MSTKTDPLSIFFVEFVISYYPIFMLFILPFFLIILCIFNHVHVLSIFLFLFFYIYTIYQTIPSAYLSFIEILFYIMNVQTAILML